MQNQTHTWRRRNYYIKRDFQWHFIVRFCLLVVNACLGFGVLIYLFSTASLTTSFEHSRLVIKSTADFILPVLGLGACLIIACIGLAVVYVVKRISHSIAGPLYRFEEQLRKLGEGHLSEDITLRDTDQLQDLSARFNEAVVSLRDKVRDVALELDALEARIAPGDTELRQAAARVRERLKAFETSSRAPNP